jgi:CheY-like chemotaxis protein
VGAGTGLGLSTVFGIVSQAGGAITVDSTPGQGATFTILLPSAPAESDAAGALGGAGAGSAGSDRATVLLVEDEAPVRATARRMLERHGHRVIEAVDGADGFQKWRAHRDQVDALVSDVRMPGLDGIALAGALLADRPGLPVVLMSGYPAGGEPGHRPLPASAVFVEKPFTAPALVEAIARARAAARQAAPGER